MIRALWCWSSNGPRRLTLQLIAAITSLELAVVRFNGEHPDLGGQVSSGLMMGALLVLRSTHIDRGLECGDDIFCRLEGLFEFAECHIGSGIVGGDMPAV